MKSTKPKIWFSRMRNEARLVRHLKVRMNSDDITSVERVEYKNKYNAGEDISPGAVPYYPVSMNFEYFDVPESYKKKWRDIFKVQMGLLVVSERMRELLQEHNIGDTTFRELPLYEFDQVTPRPEGPFFLMHIRQFGDAFDPEKSENVKKYPGGDVWYGPLGTEIPAVDADKVGDMDMWIEPRMSIATFFSDRLRQRIKDAKFKTYGLSFQRCIVT